MTESQYQAQISPIIPAAPTPLLLLTFNPTRKRRPFWVKRLRWSASPGDRPSLYPPLSNRKEYSHA